MKNSSVKGPLAALNWHSLCSARMPGCGGPYAAAVGGGGVACGVAAIAPAGPHSPYELQQTPRWARCCEHSCSTVSL